MAAHSETFAETLNRHRDEAKEAGLWHPTEKEFNDFKAAGRITDAAVWDNMTEERRKLANPNWDAKKGWSENRRKGV